MRRYLQSNEKLVKVRKSDHSVYKQPSIKAKKELLRKQRKEEDEKERNRYTNLTDKDSYKYGVFWEKGYRAIKIFKTKEEAEKFLSFQKAKAQMVIREIISW